jgi:hypothetical protein
MAGLLAWFRSPRGFLALTILIAVNALLDFALGNTLMGSLFAVLAVVLAVRTYRLWRAGPTPSS